MKRKALLTLVVLTPLLLTAAPRRNTTRQFSPAPVTLEQLLESVSAVSRSVGQATPDSTAMERQRQLELDSIRATIRPDAELNEYYLRYPPMTLQPLIFSGYRSLIPSSPEWRRSNIELMGLLAPARVQPDYSLAENPEAADADAALALLAGAKINGPAPMPPSYMPVAFGSPIPKWLSDAMRAQRIQQELEYRYMIWHPKRIDYAYWDLPVPPRLPEEDKSYAGYLKRMHISIAPMKADLQGAEIGKRHWLHYFNTSLQFSQSYQSSNWYQGGNNYLALLFNFTWNVDLNTVFHPNLLFQSALNYKLGINSNPSESMHSYSISQDNLQYNLKAGLKAFKHWFYSFNLQLKTPMFRAYPADSGTRQASFLSPGSLNLGLGMTYDLVNAKKTFKLSASISPLSYNLKTCIDKDVEHEQYGIKPWRSTASDVGSNVEANMRWQITPDILWTSRLFLFTNYDYFLGEWEHTFNFNINRFLSTQIYLHPRFDSSSEFNSSKWHYWMFKEVLSFGLSYTFSTKP